MNVAYVLNTTVLANGATIAFRKMLQGLMPLGVTPYIVVPEKTELYVELQKMGIATLVLNYRPSAYSHGRTLKEKVLFVPRMIAKIVVNRRAASHLARFLKENDIQLVHTNVGVISIGFKAAQKAKIPHIYHIREYGFLMYHYFPCPKAFIRQLETPGNYTICITKAIQAYYGLGGKDTSRVIYDGAVERKDTIPETGKEDYFLFVGRLEPAKGLDQLLVAYKSYSLKSQRPLKLLVAGLMPDTPYSLQQQDYVKNEGLSALTDFLGERHDVALLMAKARAIIISSSYEGFGLCMPEAMMQGCLAIARNTSGTKEQLDNGLEHEGQEIALRYDTSEELSHLLSEVENHPAEYYRPYIERAFRTVVRLYTTERNVREIYDFYNNILKDPKK